MQTILAAIAAAASALGLAFANLGPQAAPRLSRWQSLSSSRLTPLVVIAAVSTAALFLLTLPAAPPFSHGLTLGWGFLIGALLGLYAVFEAAGSLEGGACAARSVGLLSAACLGPSIILLVFRAYPNEALTGCALGSLLVAALWGGVARTLFAAAPTEKREALSCYRGVEVFALATVAVAAGARLAIDHFPRPDPAAAAGGYWALPALLVVGGALALAVLSGGWQRQTRRSTALAYGLAAAGVAVVIAAVLQVKLLPELAWELPLFGLLSFGLVLWGLLQGERAAVDEREFRPAALTFGAVLLSLAVATVAFKRLHGYGEALILLSALPIVALAYLGSQRSRDPSSPSGSPRAESRGESITESVGLGALGLILLLALYRVFLETAGRAPALDFQQHYDYLGVILGSGACFGLIAFTAQGLSAARSRIEAGRSALWFLAARTILLGVFLAAVPLALGAVWGAKALGAFLAGLVVAQTTWMLLAAWVVGEDRERALATPMHIYLAAAALIAAQFSRLVLGLELHRAQKVWIVGIITGIAILWVAATESSRARPDARKGSAPS
jgi:hypothetical protein